MLRVIHHDLEDDGYKFSDQIRAITNLIAIDCAVPSGTAVHHLIAQDVETFEHNAEHLDCIAPRESELGCTTGFLEARFPLDRREQAALMLPKIFEHELVLEQHSNAIRKLAPDEVSEAAGFIELSERA